MTIKKLPTTTWLLLFVVCSPFEPHNAAVNLSLPFMFFSPSASNRSPLSRASSPLMDRLFSFLNFQFDPGGFVIDFPVTSQAHVLAGILGGQLGFQPANMRL